MKREHPGSIREQTARRCLIANIWDGNDQRRIISRGYWKTGPRTNGLLRTDQASAPKSQAKTRMMGCSRATTMVRGNTLSMGSRENSAHSSGRQGKRKELGDRSELSCPPSRAQAVDRVICYHCTVQNNVKQAMLLVELSSFVVRTQILCCRQAPNRPERKARVVYGEAKTPLSRRSQCQALSRSQSCIPRLGWKHPELLRFSGR